MSDPKDPLARFAERLSLPLIAAPMFLVSGVDLVVAACGHGVIGSFPTANCRDAEQLDSWLLDIQTLFLRPDRSRRRHQRWMRIAGRPDAGMRSRLHGHPIYRHA
jgi:nitronate monooxygenase